NATTSAISEIGEIIGVVHTISSTIASSVEEQTATTNEIGRHAAAVCKAIGEIVVLSTQVERQAADTSEGIERAKALAAEILKWTQEMNIQSPGHKNLKSAHQRGTI
ncbi:MAG: hypothetical protein EBZ48_03665, partial [Proteobacteria bacterium]|nr:hypothetical protein [Pseudomonadota bacterium]